MSLFSFLRKNKQEPTASDSEFYSRAEEESAAVRGRSKRKPAGQGKQSRAENQPVDPVLPEKKRARRRLVGAVALVLAVIIGLPMVLDSEPKPLAEDISIQIPPKDKVKTPNGAAKASETSATAKVNASSSLDPKEEVIDTPLSATPAPVVPKPTALAETGQKPKEPVRSAEKPIAHVVEKVEAKPEPKPEPKPVVAKITEKPSVKVAEHSDDASRAKAILEAKPESGDAKPTPEKKPAKFTVQVAALASSEKATELQDKLKAAGIKSYTQKIATGSGERIRIRVGPFASKEEADKVRNKLSSLGLSGTLVPQNL